MADYSITFARSARKELEALEGRQVERIFHRIESLADEPRPSDGLLGIWVPKVPSHKGGLMSRLLTSLQYLSRVTCFSLRPKRAAPFV